jgi:phosphoglycolate phosphatase
MIRCVYTDLDGTLLTAGSLFRDADGGFTLLPARALEACHRAGVEVVIKSGRRKAQVMEDARLMGQTSYIFEMGCGMVIDGEETMFTGELAELDGKSIYHQIEESGAVALLLDSYRGLLEYHEPWHLNREISHLLRGLVPADEADALLDQHGHGALRLVDNGAIVPKTTLPDLPGPPHVYHLMPKQASKADAVVRHMRARDYAPEECIAVGDSREDLGVAAVVGRFFLVANAVEKDPDVLRGVFGNVEVTEGRNGEGFYEAVVRALAERQS